MMGAMNTPPRTAADPHGLRFGIAWLLPIGMALAAWRSPWQALWSLALVQATLALLELLPGLGRSPAEAPSGPVHRAVLRGYVPLQAALLAVGVVVAMRQPTDLVAAVAMGLAVGGLTGAQGITYAHELGHSRSKLDRVLAWLLMASVGYAHFMVEHYRGHHRLAATHDDPATARRGESLWAFLPRTLIGSWRSAWRLEAERLRTHRLAWHHSPLAWATAAQVAWWAALGAVFGPAALVFWLVQSAYAVFLLETVNYIEHYGLQRRSGPAGREPFGVVHAWNTDAFFSNCVLANLQRHSDHHVNPSRPYASLRPLPGPQLPTGYAGCLYLAMLPPLWRRLMEPRLQALRAA